METTTTVTPRRTTEEKTQGNLEYFKRRGSPIVAPATSIGGPICILRVSGKDLGSSLAPVLGTLPEAGTFLLKKIVDPALVLFFKAPHSFTGEDVVEIHCHGVASIVEKTCELLSATGVRMALPGEFSFRAVMNGKMSLEEAERLNLALGSDGLNAEVSSELLGSSSQGTLSANSLLKEAIAKVQAARGRVEAAIDFPEAEGEQSADLESALLYIEELNLSLSRLLTAYENFCLHSREHRIAIVGRTNVGKSTLFNLLAGGTKAIVSKVPGTTRDVLETRVRLPSGKWVRLMDTAGLREFGSGAMSDHDRLEVEGMKMSLEAAQGARLILHVRKASERTDDALLSHAEIGSEKLFHVFSHADEAEVRSEDAFDFRSDQSALSAWLLAKLDQRIDQANASASSMSEQIALSSRQGTLLGAAREECLSARAGVTGQLPLEIAALHLKESEALLKKAVGEELGHEYIGQIFSQFCLGK